MNAPAPTQQLQPHITPRVVPQALLEALQTRFLTTRCPKP